MSNGYQLVTSVTSVPKAISDQTLINIQGSMMGKGKQGEEYTLPTAVIVAHYDAAGGAPGMSFGADSNGSGVTILLEMARIWNAFYK